MKNRKTYRLDAETFKKLKTHAGVRCVGELSDNQIDAESFLG